MPHLCRSVRIRNRHLDDQFVMHLQEQLCARHLLCQSVMDVNHRQLDEVGGGALNGRIHGNALAGCLHHFVLGVQLRDIAAASQHGADVAAFLRIFHHSLQKGGNLREGAEVVLDILLRLRLGHMDVLGEGECPHAVENTEIDSLCSASHFGRHKVLRHIKDLCGGGGVDVCTGLERLLHGGIA